MFLLQRHNRHASRQSFSWHQLTVRLPHPSFYLFSLERISPTQDEYSWRGVNVNGMIEVLRAEDDSDRVFTRYVEALKVSPWQKEVC